MKQHTGYEVAIITVGYFTEYGIMTVQLLKHVGAVRVRFASRNNIYGLSS